MMFRSKILNGQNLYPKPRNKFSFKMYEKISNKICGDCNTKIPQIPHILFGRSMFCSIWDIIEKSTYRVSVFRDLDDVIFLYRVSGYALFF